MHQKKLAVIAGGVLAVAGAAAAVAIAYRYLGEDPAEQYHFNHDETELIIVNTTDAELTLFRAGNALSEATPVTEFGGGQIWLAKGNYFLRAVRDGGEAFYPVSTEGYHQGPEKDGSFALTIRPFPLAAPPSPTSVLGGFGFIPSGYFLFGDRLNPQQPHYVWTQAFFAAAFETTNAEYQQFLGGGDGYPNDSNWTAAGLDWKTKFKSQSSALLTPNDPEYQRFGQPDMPVTGVTWFEAVAYCHWLTRKLGVNRWVFAIPTEAEWEKAARGPDGFDLALGQTLSDAEIHLYNWKKNPTAKQTVIGINESMAEFRPNRYGLFHISGNVFEWTAGLNRPFGRTRPYEDDDRNLEESAGVRVARGGSWYSASIAQMYIAYRETFPPEVSHNDLGFRIIVRPMP